MSVLPLLLLKCLPYNQGNNEHQIIKNDKHMKKKTISSSTINALVVGPSTSPRINQLNQSYSDIDYFPMISGGLTETIHDERLNSNHDCYSNPSENIQVNIPITFIQNDFEANNHKKS